VGWSPGFVHDPSLHICVDVSGLIAAGNAEELFVGCIECMDQMCFFAEITVQKNCWEAPTCERGCCPANRPGELGWELSACSLGIFGVIGGFLLR